MNIDLAAFRLQALGMLRADGGSAPGGAGGGADFLDALLQARGLPSQGDASLPALAGLGGGGQSARMDNVLAQLEASNAAFLQRYNARVDEIGDEAQVLAELRARVGELGEAAQALQARLPEAGDGELKAALRAFVDRYNAWDAEFDPYFKDGALLDDVQAGEYARFALRREVGSIFHGAGKGGFELGVTDMGLSFSQDGQLRLDEAVFDSVLSDNHSAARQTLSNMAGAFSAAAAMLTADGHLLDRRIDNAGRAVSWAAENQPAVDAEFGPGALSARLRG